MRISSIVKTTGCAALISLAAAHNIYARPLDRTQDVFVHQVSPSGSSDSLALINAPSPKVKIKGITQTARIVVDASKNILYKYNDFGQAEKAYLVASGKTNTPTKKGVSVVSHIETFPFKNAPSHTKRRRNPYPYGPNIIILDKLIPETGERLNSGQWIHGNNKASSIGTYASQGCVRMDNEVIKELVKQVKRGDIVIFK